MGSAFKRGKRLGPVDLSINVRNAAQVLVDPYALTYSLFDVTTGQDIIIGAPNQIPFSTSTGVFYANTIIPLDANIGVWVVRWNLIETAGANIIEITQEFEVVSDEILLDTQNTKEKILQTRLRTLLRDNNPDRNYRFRPPNTDAFLQTQTEVMGYIWTDEELYEYLFMAVDDLNSYPPYQFYSMITIPDRYRTAILYRAASFACRALALNWVADEFSVVGEELVTVYTEALGDITLPISELYELYSLELIRRELKGASIKLPSNLALSESIVDGKAFVRSMSSTGVERLSVFSGVVKHSTSHKKILRVSLASGATISCTEDHSLFVMNNGALLEITPKELQVGSILVSQCSGEVVSIEELADSPEFTYDLMVPGDQNFFLASGILAHNTYSIGGVSLDIDKSSKYQAMADGYDQQYENMRTGIKASVKIVKGLSQSRYGMSLSSALGPISSEGAFSRRSFLGV